MRHHKVQPPGAVESSSEGRNSVPEAVQDAIQLEAVNPLAMELTQRCEPRE